MIYRVIIKTYCLFCKNKLEQYRGVFNIDRPLLPCKYCGQILKATETRNEWELISSSKRNFLIFLSIFQFLSMTAGFIFMTIVLSFIIGFNENTYYSISMVLIIIAIIIIVAFNTIIPFNKTIIASKKRMIDIKYREVLKKHGILEY
jgi:hypothetical protein